MEIKWFNDFYKQIADTKLSHWLEVLPSQLAQWQKQQLHGDFAKWHKLVNKLPDTNVSHINLKDAVEIGLASDIDEYTQKQIIGLLKQFKPWRKRPFHLHGIPIDTD